MIPANFDYYRPDTIEEAITVYRQIRDTGLKPFYYGGGTEIITMARMGSIAPDAVIDIKGIPECREHGLSDGRLVFGAGVTLAEIAEADLFPLLSLSVSRIADHTVQGKITLGGNICGTIVYRESMLPLLLADAELTVARPDGLIRLPFVEALNNGKRLPEGELLVKITLAADFAKEKHWHIKKVKSEKIGYPLLTVAALSRGGVVRMAFTGVCGFPVRTVRMEAAFSPGKSEEIARAYIGSLPSPIAEDLEGSAAYREWVLQRTIAGILDS
jgi:CO/xanthine dehydrogenase FAD-binding subunit